jgi:hypothetical protein
VTTLGGKPFIPFKAGIYPFKVVKAVWAVSKASGEPMIVITLELVRDYQTYIVTDYMTLLYIERVEEFFKATGKRVASKIRHMQPHWFDGTSGFVSAGTLIYNQRVRPKILNYLLPKESKNVKRSKRSNKKVKAIKCQY